MSALAPIGLSWTPPAISQWNFTYSKEICDAASNWTGAYIVEIATYDEESIRADPLSYSIEYLRAILPADYRSNTSDAILAAWYLDSVLYNSSQESLDFFDELIEFTMGTCLRDLCGKIGWKEDPDIAGVGMLVSYYIVAVLTSIYYLALIVPVPSGQSKPEDKDQVDAFAKDDRPRDTSWVVTLAKATEPFRKTAKTFLLADLVFTVGMLWATLWRFRTVLSHPSTPYTIFNQLTSFFMLCFSVLSCLALQTVTKPKKTQPHDRHTYRWSLALPWIVIVPMIAVIFGYYRNAYPAVGSPSYNSMTILHDRNAQLAEYLWLDSCDPLETRRQLEVVLYAGLGILSMNATWFSLALAYRVLRWQMNKRQKKSGARTAERSAPPWAKTAYHRGSQLLRLLDGLVCTLTMWVFLAFFHKYRDDSHDVAGNSDGGSKDWSFGQILALAAWAPTVLELINRICLPVLVRLIHRDPFSNQQEKLNDGHLPEQQSRTGYGRLSQTV